MAEEIRYRIDQFEGPLDLLLTLIEKNKVDIMDIPIAMIFDQYMEYIEQARKMDLEIASEFIVMASTLMLIKSKMLLPRESEDAPDPRREIADAVLLYKQAKLAAVELRPMYEEFSGRMTKDQDEVPPEKGLPLNMSTEQMTKALFAMLRRFKVAEKDPINLVNPLIKPHVVSVEEKIEEIIALLEEHGEASLFFLLKDGDTRPELLARFMGILELIKIHRINIVGIRFDSDGGFECEDNGLDMKFALNPNYVPGDITESEFDAMPSESESEDANTESTV